ncbi:protein phosphatase [Saccharobesus litoralis]|uniref:Protein phosphatase CheZ n=1 Tax=Saccharobesus litoralis TaxID=2172099 RepID=A0A2S0VT54_9ALTE|nr:protein phosphatase CheZ [Saccharobesus litoralis]AWB67387.1 protein phosphatase [Saccharobesus litoralis]
MSSVTPYVDLDTAKQLVALLESGDIEQANAIVEESSKAASEELFAEVGKLTRQLHNSLQDFQLDSRIANLANEDIPDAQNRLAYVIEMTESAANRTMDAVEASIPVADQLNEHIKAVIPTWSKLMNRQISLEEFKELCYSVDDILKKADSDSDLLRSQLNDVLMAQDFQDLTGQVIRRVIDLVREVEENLVHLLTVFGTPVESQEEQAETISGLDESAEGPIVNAEERTDVVSGQDDVDDLLSSLGF